MLSYRDDMLTYALKNGQIVHISEVEKGAESGCVCISCGDSLIAKKGNKNEHHFAHSSNEGCVKSSEIEVKLRAKKILEDRGYIRIPELITELSYRNASGNRISVEKFPLKIDNIEFEDEVDYNLIIRKDNLKILVLIITKKNQQSTLPHLESPENKGFSVLTIDFTHRKRSAFFDTFSKALTDEVDKKRWHSSRIVKDYFDKKIYSLAKNYKIQNQIVQNCPRKKNASYIDTCMQCTALIDEVDEEKYVKCLGAFPPIRNYKDLDEIFNGKKPVANDKNNTKISHSVPECVCGRYMKIRKNNNNEAFWGCSAYGRQCTAKYTKPLKCPKCGGKLYREDSMKYADFLECKTSGCGYAESVSSFLKGFKC